MKHKKHAHIITSKIRKNNQCTSFSKSIGICSIEYVKDFFKASLIHQLLFFTS